MAVDRIRTTVYLPTQIHAAAKLAADTVGQSLSQFVTLAVAQRARRWEDPITGERVNKHVDSLVDTRKKAYLCFHPACDGVDARQCTRPKEHREQGLWEEVDTRTGEMPGGSRDAR